MAGITFTEGSGVNDSIFGKSQAPIRMFIEKRGEAFEQESVVKDIFAMEKSEHWGEKLTGLTAMNGFQPVGENGAYPYDEAQEGYDKFIENVTWKDSFHLSREIVDDAKTLDLKKQPLGFVAGYYRTRENFGAALMGGAIRKQTSVTFSGKKFDTSSADKKCLFATDHPSKLGKGTQTNQFSDAFSADALAEAEARMQDFRGDNGEILDICPDTILIPNIGSLKKAVFGAIGADKEPTTANNAFNFVFGRWTVIVWPYLNQFITASTSPWVLIDTRHNTEYGGAVWFDRVNLEVRSTIDEGTDANVWRGYSRFGAGFNDWRFAAVGGVDGGTALITT